MGAGSATKSAPLKPTSADRPVVIGLRFGHHPAGQDDDHADRDRGEAAFKSVPLWSNTVGVSNDINVTVNRILARFRGETP
jgi:hypothetical protein